jgi:hypothetical protein
MRVYLLLIFISFSIVVRSQLHTQNLIIVTTDGFRWQEVFKGMDSAIANNKDYNQEDSAEIYKRYWDDDAVVRRKKLLPFIWTEIESRGQIYGNRSLGNKVDNANRYWFSYPGYNEIMTGNPDTLINSNSFPPNPQINVLEFLNKQARLKGKVAAFTAWDAFNRILNEDRAKFPVIAAFDTVSGSLTREQKTINRLLLDSYRPWGEGECLDVFTHYGAFEYLKVKRPKVLYIAYGETDEWAHSGQYRDYLNAAHQVDEWIRELWNWVQSDPQYRNKTTIFITVDHGRGDKIKTEWRSHNNKILDSHEIWFAVIGPDTEAKGEMKTDVQIHQQQFAQTFAKLMGYVFKPAHPVAEEVKTVLK